MKNPLSLTKYWLEKIIIDLDLCPFARIPFRQGQIHLRVCESLTPEENFQSFIEECERLLIVGPSKISTTLIAYPNSHRDFLLFNDFVGELERRLEEGGLDDTFLVVAFHPRFYFDGLEENDLANYVNRSPFPTVHIIRTIEMEKAASELKSGEQLSFFNEKKLKALSPQKIKELFYYL